MDTIISILSAICVLVSAAAIAITAAVFIDPDGPLTTEINHQLEIIELRVSDTIDGLLK